MTDNDLYYRRRIEEEVAAADSAGEVSVSNIHREMARLYRDLLDHSPDERLAPDAEAVFG